MTIIAVAGGTSPTLGHSIVTAIQLTSNIPIILSRKKKATSGGKSPENGAEIRYVDYTDHASLVNALRGVQTVISVLKIPGSAWATYQINLLNAAVEAGVKRFAPSEFGQGPLACNRVDATACKSQVWNACLTSGLECTRFTCGMFMNYLAIGRTFVSGEEQKARALFGLDDDPILWDFQRGVAELPICDNGSFPKVTFTEIGDVGRFVAAACLLTEGSWQKEMSIAGDTVALDEVVSMAKSILGIQLDVKAVSRKELQKRVDTVHGIGETREEISSKLVAQLELVMLEDKYGMAILDPLLNQLCFHIKPMLVKEFLQNTV